MVNKFWIWAGLIGLAVSLAGGRFLVIAVPGLGEVPLLDLIVVTLVIVGIIWYGQEKPRSKVPLFVWFGGLFSLIALISLLGSARWLDWQEIIKSGFFWGRQLTYFGLVFWAHGLARQRQSRRLLNILGGVWAAVAIIGLGQLIWMPNLGFWERWGWDPHQARLVSTFLDPNLLGGFLVLGLVVSLEQLSSSELSKPQRNKWMGLAVLLLLSAILTYSRSTLVALAVLGLLKGWQYRKAVGIGLLAGLIVYSLSPRLQERVQGAINLDVTAQYRLASWQEAINIIRHEPLLGVGYNTLEFTRNNYDYQPRSRASTGFDSSLLTIGATTGSVGLAVYLGLLAAILAWGRRQLKLGSSLAGIAITSTFVLLVHSLFVNSWLYSPIMAVWWIMIGLTWVNHTNNV